MNKQRSIEKKAVIKKKQKTAQILSTSLMHFSKEAQKNGNLPSLEMLVKLVRVILPKLKFLLSKSSKMTKTYKSWKKSDLCDMDFIPSLLKP